MDNVHGPNVTVIFSGIKCDNPVCNFADPFVEVKDYDQWLNKPCPYCGCNLLTQEDYDYVKETIQWGIAANKEPIEHQPDKVLRMHASLDGSGKPTFSEIEIIDKENL